MNHRKKAVFNWSGGKDSALALQKILQENEFEVVSLLTTVTEATQTSSVHSIPLKLLLQQADSIGIPLHPVALSKGMASYAEEMTKAVAHFKSQGVTHFIFGDIFLSDVKSFRESKLNPLGIEVVEPLWGESTEAVCNNFLQSGIRATIIVTQADRLDQTFIGKEINHTLIHSLPAGIDPCGENGEYHTFAYDGPLFKEKIDFKITGIHKTSNHFRLDTGETKRYDYWQAEFK